MSPIDETHKAILGFQATANISPDLLIPIGAGLNPLLVMLEPHMNLDVLWQVINANAANGVAAVFSALETNAAQIITSPSFEAQIFAMGCKVASNLWAHGTPALMAAAPLPATRPPGTDPYGNVP